MSTGTVDCLHYSDCIGMFACWFVNLCMNQVHTASPGDQTANDIKHKQHCLEDLHTWQAITFNHNIVSVHFNHFYCKLVEIPDFY